METVAIYREERIKTYGFDLARGLALIELSAGPDEWVPAAEVCVAAGAAGGTYRMIGGRWAGESETGLSVVMSGDDAEAFVGEAEKRGVRTKVEAPVEMIHFQGPHYGDRYGVADAALKALEERGVKWLRMVCAGSSIYIILPGGSGGAAEEALAAAFEAPEK